MLVRRLLFLYITVMTAISVEDIRKKYGDVREYVTTKAMCAKKVLNNTYHNYKVYPMAYYSWMKSYIKKKYQKEEKPMELEPTKQQEKKSIDFESMPEYQELLKFLASLEQKGFNNTEKGKEEDKEICEEEKVESKSGSEEEEEEEREQAL
ncbi:hypothetical protein CWI36_1406p0020 [Hamiltosporidium magnivora]|uniref:Uncharacterized protein n=1 Tax=Hamiltosporidium magnivora TaxID=148818 RepID=A0A4Q9L1H4_9MICR|nr:hypothetical protein CWI36_1406p0020 [Hamiltosporidium magnivora]